MAAPPPGIIKVSLILMPILLMSIAGNVVIFLFVLISQQFHAVILLL
jgi:hypothetical protein